MGILLTIIILWMIPILIFAGILYIDITPGESVDEYIRFTDADEIMPWLFIPAAGYFALGWWISHLVWDRIKDYIPKNDTKN